jgi:hypothetical protein
MRGDGGRCNQQGDAGGSDVDVRQRTATKANIAYLGRIEACLESAKLGWRGYAYSTDDCGNRNHVAGLPHDRSDFSARLMQFPRKQAARPPALTISDRAITHRPLRAFS